MKKLLFASLAIIALMGAGCTQSTSINSSQDKTTGTETTTATSIDEGRGIQDGIASTAVHVIGNSAFTLTLPANISYSDRNNGGRWQNYVSKDGPRPLDEGQYFLEFIIEETSDLEFNDQTENITQVTIDGQEVDKGSMKAEYIGGDSTKYVVNYFRAGNGEDRAPVLIRVYADSESGLAAGEASLEDISWSN